MKQPRSVKEKKKKKTNNTLIWIALEKRQCNKNIIDME